MTDGGDDAAAAGDGDAVSGGDEDGTNGDWPGDWRFLDARITETIATTRGDDGVNVAPMGVVSEPGEPTAHARLWEGSDTRANVRATGAVTVNVTSDPLAFARAALSDDTDGLVRDGRLADADAWIRCRAERADEERGGDVARWRLEPVEGRRERASLCTVRRGVNAVVEACVHATRLHVDPGLRELVEHHLGVAWRCGSDRTREAARLVADAADVPPPDDG